MGPQAPALGAARLPDAVAGVAVRGAIWSTTTTAANRNNANTQIGAVCSLNRRAGAAILAAHAWRKGLIPPRHEPWPPRELA